ncbi:hypothetical protein PR048_005639 [Dryococelus australis]|uniref:Uncharacterized protein n=1 Tax=Dryococelus australis TaxID=614101 RepID=A0ABQ9I8T2_9NEOP|nr:hypothetical protein PR048_005639 [Dryococelus australis]
MLATGFVSKQSQVKVAMLLNVIGDEAAKLYNTFVLTDKDRQDNEKVLKAFADYCDPVKNIVVKRFKFHSRLPEESESYKSFLTDLKKLIKSCEFKDQADSVMRDRIVLHI